MTFPSTTFISKVTTITRAWLQAVNDYIAGRPVVSVLDYGATAVGAAGDDTIAIQAAVDSLANLAGPGKLVFPRTSATGYYRITAPIVFPLAWARNEIDLCGSEIRYDGPVDATASVFKMTKNLIYSNDIRNGILNANDKAGFVIYAVGEGNLYAIKRNKLSNVWLKYPTVAGVQIGNMTASGLDQDGSDWSFFHVQWQSHNAGALDVIVDGDNILNTGFHHCGFFSEPGANLGGHVRFLHGSGYYFYDTFFGYLGTNSNYCIDHRNGSLTVVGANTEEGSILVTSGMITEQNTIHLANVTENEGTSSNTPEYAIYAPVGIVTMQSCFLGRSSYPRKVYFGDTLNAAGVVLGSLVDGTNYGTYEIDYPDRCEIEGQRLSDVQVLNGNPTLHLWRGSAAGDYPEGYQSSGFGTFTVQRSTLHAVQGPYTAKVVTTVGYGTGNDIDGVQVCLPVNNTTKTGAKSIMVVVRGYCEALSIASLNLRANACDSSGTVLNGNNVAITTSAGNTFEGWLNLNCSDTATVYANITLGVGAAAATATFYIDNLYVIPLAGFTTSGTYNYRAFVGAWTSWVKPQDGLLEYAKCGIPVGGTAAAPFRQFRGSAAPTQGDYRVGDITWNLAPAAGQPAGWICTVAGTPGTWKAMGNLS